MGQGAPVTVTRRRVLVSASLAPLAGLPACAPGEDAQAFNGGWVGAQAPRGHRLLEPKSGTPPAPATLRRAAVLVVGAGVAGLGCARALARAGIDDVHVLDLEDQPGGNSRGHRMAGLACPLGAHYLPLPGDAAMEVAELLEDLGLRRRDGGRVVYDERHLCHSPQERLCIDGHWHDGLLPPVAALPAAERSTTQAQYQRFSELVAALGRGPAGASGPAFAVPSSRSAWNATLQALDGISFARWLDARGLRAPALRWYLDYCCRDDYGAGAAQVSAWAGIHYFASRHGFHAPGDDSAERDGVLTWPEGNGWLTTRLAAPLKDRLHTGVTALRVSETSHQVSVDVWNEAAKRTERWLAPRVVMAVPLFIAARLLDATPAALTDACAAMQWAPWLVANLQLDEPLADRPGAPPSWDNVVYTPGATGSGALGYVDAMHQSLQPVAGATVLTAYYALGGNSAAELKANRAALLADDWRPRAEAVLRDLARAHADLPRKVRQADLMRYGHAMAVPAPGVRSSAALQALAAHPGRVLFAHSDLSGCSVFEEALYRGQEAAAALIDRTTREARVT